MFSRSGGGTLRGEAVSSTATLHRGQTGPGRGRQRCRCAGRPTASVPATEAEANLEGAQGGVQEEADALGQGEALPFLGTFVNTSATYDARWNHATCAQT